jgi:hypothetical protein
MASEPPQVWVGSSAHGHEQESPSCFEPEEEISLAPPARKRRKSGSVTSRMVRREEYAQPVMEKAGAVRREVGKERE